MFMILGLLALTLATTQGSPVSGTTRNVRHNSYYLYNRDTLEVQIFPDVQSISATSHSFRPVTAIIVHGHEASAFNSLNPTVKDAFLASEDMSVIVVDWSGTARQRYRDAVQATPIVGVELAEFIEFLVLMDVVTLENLHLVGFNLGAHVVGFAGKHLRGQVARITGLDPAASQWGPNSGHLTASDAVYVEVIHTNGNGLTSNGIGRAIGDVDFFMNGGSNQPGCLTNTCDNNRAWQYFAATLIYNHLTGNLCDSNAQITTNRCRGYALPVGNNDLRKRGSGSFRANTKRSYPY